MTNKQLKQIIKAGAKTAGDAAKAIKRYKMINGKMVHDGYIIPVNRFNTIRG